MPRNKFLYFLPFLLGSALWAQPPAPPRPVLLILDANHDGELSESEILAAPSALAMLDKNHDGKVTMEEYMAKMPNSGATPDEQVQRLMTLDKNGDGELTKDELPERMQALLVKGDKDQNGRLTPEEIRTMFADQGPVAGRPLPPGGAIAAMRSDPLINALDTDHDGAISPEEMLHAADSLKTLDVNHDGKISSAEMRPRMDPKQRADHMLEEWDTNKDGKIAKAEAPDRMQTMFDKLDKNGDGFLTMDELIAYFSSPESNQQRPPRPNAQESK